MGIIIASLLSPALALLIILCFCLKNWNKEITGRPKCLAIPFGMIFGTFGYSLRFFSESNDLLTYFSQINTYSNYSFGEILAKDSENLFLRDGLFFFVNKCGNNYILPFIVGFIIYFIVFYILFDMIERSGKKYRVCDALFLGLIAVGILAPYTIILNTRCVLSFMLVSFAVYRDMIQKKHNLATFLLYILPIGLHSSAVVIIVIRLLCVLFRKLNKAKWVILSLVLLFPTIVDFLYGHVAGILSGPIGNVLSSAINKAYYYLHWTSGGWATQIESSTSSMLIKVFGTIFILFIIYILFRKRPNKLSEEPLLNKPMVGFLFLVAVFALGCLNIKTGAFWRFEAIVVLFSPVILVQVDIISEKNRRIFHVLTLYALALMFYNVLYQISNTNTAETMVNFFTTSGFKVIYEMLRGAVHLIG